MLISVDDLTQFSIPFFYFRLQLKLKRYADDILLCEDFFATPTVG